MVRKRITVDRLAAMVANGVQAFQDEMREGFKQLAGRLDAVEGRLGGVEGRLDAVEAKQSEHGALLEEHSRYLVRIERKLDNTIARDDDHSVRIERLERQRPGQP